MKLTLKDHVLHWARMLRDGTYRRSALERPRLEKLPPYRATITTLLGQPFEIVDAPSFLEMHEHIWEQEIYRFTPRRDKPLILDCGANIGLSVLVFKQNYADCSIVAFEPDDTVFKVLERNMRRTGLRAVELVLL